MTDSSRRCKSSVSSSPAGADRPGRTSTHSRPTRRWAVGALVVLTTGGGALLPGQASAGSAGTTDIPAPPPGELSVYAGNGAAGPATPGPATLSRLGEPVAVATDGKGDVYFTDYIDNEVDKVDRNGTLSVVAGTGTAGIPAPGPATSSPLNYPIGLAVDGSGNLYVTDNAADEVVKVTPGGTLSVVAGTGAPGPATPGPATSSGLRAPVGVAVDSSGDVYVVDTGNHLVEKITPGGTLSVIAGDGSNGTTVPGPATRSPLGSVFGVTVGAHGDVYFSDLAQARVYGVDPEGVLSVVAGTGTSALPTPGPATDSPLRSPFGLVTDAAGNLYVSDAGSLRIVRITPWGTLSIVAGDGTQARPVPGPATASPLVFPIGLGADPSGDLYIADAGADEVEKVAASVEPTVGIAADPSGGYVTEDIAGGVAAYGTASHGSVRSLGVVPDSPIVGITATGTGGYLEATAAGNVYAFGTAFHGSPHTRGTHLGSPIVGITATGTGGYLEATAAGNVYVFGTAFHGSPHTRGTHLGSPIVGITATGTGGYLEATAAGNVYAFGTAFHGSPHTRGTHLGSPIVGITATGTGGYLEATAAGNVYAFGTAFHGSPHTDRTPLTSPVVGIAATAAGGYRLVTDLGAVLSYGT